MGPLCDLASRIFATQGGMAMNPLIEELGSQVSAQRLRDMTLGMVRIPSPTGDSAKVSEFYADTVRGLGLSVEILRDHPTSPSTIARYGDRPGHLTLTLDGHLDTIHAPHPDPYVEHDRIYGRGAGDMKSGIAAMVEATRVIVETGLCLGGNLVLVTHSLHEAPVGRMEGLRCVIDRGDVFVDAALVAEGGFDTLAIRGKGQALFEIDIGRQGGQELPLAGALSVSDVNIIVREAGIPAVAHGTGSTTAHADLEWVDVANIVRTTKVFLATIVNYLGVERR